MPDFGEILQPKNIVVSIFEAVMLLRTLETILLEIYYEHLTNLKLKSEISHIHSTSIGTLDSSMKKAFSSNILNK